MWLGLGTLTTAAESRGGAHVLISGDNLSSSIVDAVRFVLKPCSHPPWCRYVVVDRTYGCHGYSREYRMWIGILAVMKKSLFFPSQHLISSGSEGWYSCMTSLPRARHLINHVRPSHGFDPGKGLGQTLHRRGLRRVTNLGQARSLDNVTRLDTGGSRASTIPPGLENIGAMDNYPLRIR